MKWQNFVREYFTHNRRERRGVLILAAIVVFLLILTQVLNFFQPKMEVDVAVFEEKVKQYNDASNKNYLEQAEYNSNLIEEEIVEPTELFYFNPNTISAAEWRKLGLSNKQIKVIQNYLQKGGKFYRKEDVKKIYSISTTTYNRLEPYIQIPKAENKFKEYDKEKPKYEKYKPKEIAIINVNTADTAKLKTLRGIGSVFSKRIIKYRDLLGGFHKQEQLLEVYGMKEETYQKISAKIEVNEEEINKININTCTKDELKKHPYIKWQIANSIVAIREQHGLYTTVEGIKKSDLVNAELYSKIAPYLTIE